MSDTTKQPLTEGQKQILAEMKPMTEMMRRELSGVGREKFWSELTDAERIGRLRIELKRARNDLDTTINRVRKLESSMERHGHGPAGESVLPIHNPDIWPAESSGRVRRDDAGDDCYI